MIKMIVRGLLRYRFKGKKLFILIALSTAALIFNFSFASSFVSRQEQVLVETTGGHLTLVSSSPEAKAWFSLPEVLEGWIKSQPEVAASGPILKLFAAAFHMSTHFESGYELVGVEANLFSKLYPSVAITGGVGDFSSPPGATEIPLLRNEIIQAFEIVETDDAVVPEDFLFNENQWVDLQKQMILDFPSLAGLFQQPKTLGEYLDVLNTQLKNPKWIQSLSPLSIPQGDYDFADLMDELEDGQVQGSRLDLLSVLNKKLLQGLYPKILRPVHDQTRLGVPLTLHVDLPSFAKSQSAGFAVPKMLPITYVGFASTLPLFSFVSYADLGALRRGLDLPPRASTSYQILLNDFKELEAFQKRLTKEIQKGRHHVKIFSYKTQESGSYYLTIGTAFEAVTSLLAILLVAVMAIFIANAVSLSIKSRRREIGTAQAMGMGLGKAGFLLLVEFLFLITLSWIFGALLGMGLCQLFANPGLPGMIFFPSQHLPISWNWEQLWLSYLVLFLVSIPAILLPLGALKGLKPIELLKEAS